MTLRRFTVLACLSLLALCGCTQRETDIGAGAITGVPEPDFTIVEAVADTSANWAPDFSNGYGPSLQFGDTSGWFAFFAVKFDLESSLPDSFRCDTMWLRLHRNRVWPEEGVPGVQIRIREITESWEEGDLVPGTLPGRLSYPEVDSFLVSADDTFFVMGIPASIRSKWLANDTTSQGLLFEPRSTGAFIEFYSSEPLATRADLPPALFLEGREYELDADSAWTDSAWTQQVAPSDDAYLVLDSAPTEPGRFHISQGYAQRSAIHFNLSTLGLDYTNLANRAELTLFADTSNAAIITYRGQNMIFNHGVMEDRAWLSDSSVFNGGVEMSFSVSNGSWDSTNTIYTMNASGAVANWIANPNENYGLQAFASSESQQLGRTVFHSAQSEDSLKRPRLKIWLTESQ